MCRIQCDFIKIIQIIVDTLQGVLKDKLVNLIFIINS